MDQLAFVIDPLGRKTKYTWCACGSLASLMDPAGNVTTWNHDLQGRVVQKVYADSSTVNYGYEPTTSRLQSRTDALNQTKNYTYNLDDSLATITYTNAVNFTPSVTISYDTHFPRVTQITTGASPSFSYGYSYNAYITDPFAPPITGGGRLASITNSLLANATITFSYDVLGRTTNRSINGSANSITWAYDGTSRVTSEVNALGTFNYSYVDQTPLDKGDTRLAQVSYPNGQVTKFGWYGTNGDERLKEILNLRGATSSPISQFNYAYNASGEITRWGQQQTSNHQTAYLGYDAASQLISSQAGAGTLPAPYASQHYYAYDAAANRTAAQQSLLQQLKLSGSFASSDVVSLTVHDSALFGGQLAVNYTVQSGDTLAGVAAQLAATVSADSQLQAVGIDAVTDPALSGATITLRSRSTNPTTYTASSSGSGAFTFGINRSIQNVSVIGGINVGEGLILTIRDNNLSGTTVSKTHTILAGDTQASIAADFASQINSDSNLSGAGISATSANQVISVTSLSPNATAYETSFSGLPGTLLTTGISLNGTTSALIGGVATTGNVLTITVYDAGLANGSRTVSYTTTAGDTLTDVTTGIKTAINNDLNLQYIGVTATSSGTQLNVTSVSVNPTSYVLSKSTGAAETITWGLPPNGTVTTVIAGSTVTPGDILTITVYDANLSGGSKAASYTVQPGDTTPTVAAGLAAAIHADSSLSAVGIDANSVTSVVNITSTSTAATTYAASTSTGATETIALSSNVGVSKSNYNNLNELTSITAGGAVQFKGTTDRPVQPMTINSAPAIMPTAQAFRGSPVLSAGDNSVSITATSGGGNTTTDNYSIKVSSPTAATLTYDANGNMTNDGTNSYAWDAEDRLTKITYPGTDNFTDFVFDALGRNVKIVETTSGSVTSTKQFVWCDLERCEERDGSSVTTKQFFNKGQKNGTSSYFYTKDHLGSIRELADTSAAVQALYLYSPYGEKSTLIENAAADFQFGGHYQHARSGLNLAPARPYSSSLARFLGRDPLAESASINLFGYVGNDPINGVDPLGLQRRCPEDEDNGPPVLRGGQSIPTEPLWNANHRLRGILHLSQINIFSLGVLRGSNLFTVPPNPRGADIYANIAEAENHPGDYLWFYSMVHNKGLWDYKQQGRIYEDFGNFNFGATAAAAGIPLTIALRGAGFASFVANFNGSLQFGGFFLGGRPFGDDPQDQAMIRQGYYSYGTLLPAAR